MQQRSRKRGDPHGTPEIDVRCPDHHLPDALREITIEVEEDAKHLPGGVTEIGMEAMDRREIAVDVGARADHHLPEAVNDIISTAIRSEIEIEIEIEMHAADHHLPEAVSDATVRVIMNEIESETTPHPEMYGEDPPRSHKIEVEPAAPTGRKELGT